MTFNEFEQSYFTQLSKCESYRYGQHFINLFIKDSTSDEMCQLWEEKDISEARLKCVEIAERYDWDWFDLPLIK